MPQSSRRNSVVIMFYLKICRVDPTILVSVNSMGQVRWSILLTLYDNDDDDDDKNDNENDYYSNRLLCE